MKRVALVVLLAAGCGGGGSPTVAVPSASVTPDPSPTVTSSPTAAQKDVLVLEPDGLGVSDGSASIRHLPFATTTAPQVQEVVTRLLGAGTPSNLPDCGQGPRSSYRSGGLSLLFDGKAWVGWTSQASLTTVDGIGVGQTKAQVQASGTAFDFTESTLGEEFLAENGFGGILEAGRVSTLYAGETCFFR